MSVGSIIGGGVRLIRTQPQVVAIWTVLYGVVIALGTMSMRPFIAAIMDAQRQNAANLAMGIKQPPVFPAGLFGTVFLLELVFVVLMVIAFAAVVRAVAQPTGDRFAYIRIGMDELRLLGLGILLVIILFGGELVALVLMALLAGLSAMILGKTGAVLVGAILVIALFCALIYAEVRISLAGAMTVIEGRIVIKDAWRATKGRFWTLFGAYLLLGLGYLVVTVIILAITSPQLLTAYASLNPQAMQAAAQAQQSSYATVISFRYIVGLILGAVVTVPLGVVFCGSIATAALEMRGVPSTVAAQFE